MKNLFKNLMLVAVAAMAFTACTETNEEVNAVAKKTVISGVAVIDTDDTRSGFTGKEGDVYKSAWDGDENIKVFGDNGEEVVTTIDADGKFTAEFNQAPSFITVCSPAEAWTSQYSCSIATEQTPRANSVDPAVHVLQSQSTQVVDGSASILVSPQNGCYGKMTINVADAEIEQVKLDLKGLKYHSSEDSLSYTLNATTDIVDNTFWFAIEAPMTVQEFTVTAYCAGDKTLTKTVTIPDGRNLKFEWGHVSTFSVSNLVEAAPAFTVDYQYATLSWNNTYSRFELTGNGYNVTQFYLNSSDAPNNNSIKPGAYTYAGNTVSNPAVGTFSLRHILGSGSGSSHYVNDASMSVTIEDGQYCIVITIISAGNGNIVGKTFGYKGLPDGFVLPSEGGDSGDDNTGDGGEEDGFIQMTKLYYDSSALNIHNFVMLDADGSNKITISLNKYDALQTWIPVYEYTSNSLSVVNGNSGYCSLQYDTAKINGTSYQLNATGHTLKVLSSSNGGNHEIELYVVTSGGDEYKFKFSGNLGL